MTELDINSRINTNNIMEETPKRRSARLPEIRLYPEEKAAIELEFSTSFYNNKSEFIRYKRQPLKQENY